MLLGPDDPHPVSLNLIFAVSPRLKVMQLTRGVYQVVALCSNEQVLSASGVQLFDMNSQISNLPRHGVGGKLMIGSLTVYAQLESSS